MSGSSRVATVEVQPTVAALLQEATKIQRCGSVSFSANIDGAEKGIRDPPVNLIDMKRATTAKNNASPPSLAGNPKRSAEAEQASSTGANRYAEVDMTEGNSIEQEFQEDVKGPQVRITPTTTSFTTSQDNGTPSSEKNSTQNKGDFTQNVDTGYDRIINRHYESYPLGFPRLAAFLNSTESFAIARRFGTAHSRVLLHLSCEITSLEKKLDELDEVDSKTSTRYRLRRNEHHETWDPAQKVLIDKLKLRLSEYDDLLLKDSSLRAMAPAPIHDHLSVFHWIYGHKPLDLGQYDFIYHRDDFVSLANRSRNGFDDFIKSCLNRWPNSWFQAVMSSHAIHCSAVKTDIRLEPLHVRANMKGHLADLQINMQRFFRVENKSEDTQDKHVYLFSSDKISFVAKIMGVCIAVTILLVPVFLLFLTEMSRKAAAVMVLVFVLVFATLMSLFTSAKVEHVFVGTCTYCAVLVTFLGNVQGGTAGVGSS